jgi:hypothetical protein
MSQEELAAICGAPAGKLMTVTFRPTSFHQSFSAATRNGTEPSSAGCELTRTSCSACAAAWEPTATRIAAIAALRIA